MKFLSIILFVFIFVSGVQAQRFHVYVFIAEECPICNYMGKPLHSLAKKYDKDVSFHAVFPAKNSNYKTSQLFKQKYDLPGFETLLDKDQKITRSLGATVTPEVVVTNAEGDIMYRGRINSAYYAPGKMKHSSIKNDLDETLSTLLKGGLISQPWPKAIGCYITIYANQ